MKEFDQMIEYASRRKGKPAAPSLKGSFIEDYHKIVSNQRTYCNFSNKCENCGNDFSTFPLILDEEKSVHRCPKCNNIFIDSDLANLVDFKEKEENIEIPDTGIRINYPMAGEIVHEILVNSTKALAIEKDQEILNDTKLIEIPASLYKRLEQETKKYKDHITVDKLVEKILEAGLKYIF